METPTAGGCWARIAQLWALPPMRLASRATQRPNDHDEAVGEYRRHQDDLSHRGVGCGVSRWFGGFDPPQVLRIRCKQVALLGAVTADVGNSQGPSTRVTVGGLENVVWMLRNALTGARVWFAQDGRVWTTES